MLFVGLGASGVVPIAHSLLFLEGQGFAAGADDDSLAARFHRLDARMGLRWVLLQGGLYILGAFIYAVSISPPCCIFPSLIADSTPRPVCPNAGVPAALTSGVAHIKSSTSSSCWLRLPIFAASCRHTRTITPSWAPSVRLRCYEHMIAYFKRLEFLK